MARKPTHLYLTRTLAALKPIVDEIKNRKPGVVSEDNWNPDFHIELTVTVAECKEIVALATLLEQITEAVK